MSNIPQWSCEKFADETFSSAPVPGGGGVAALVGSIGAALAGMVCNRDVHPLARELSIGIDDDGYLRSRDNIASITQSDCKGIFFAGAATGPKTIPETLAEARSAALDIHQYLCGQ